MPSIDRPLSGDSLLLELDDELNAARTSLVPLGRSARTLLKDGHLRVTLIVLAAGGSIAEHSADGPITVQVLAGAVQFTAGETVHDIAPGQLLTLHAGIRHSVSSREGGAFLLTVALRA